jgi:hypothetical protein
MLLAGALTASSLAAPLPPPTPPMVSGKEYSDHLDVTSMGVLDPHQNIWWKGDGVTVGDTFDYTMALPFDLSETEVDALANINDFLYFGVSHTDSEHLLTSFTGVGDIWYTADVSHAPVHGMGPPKVSVWATGPVDINSGSPPADVDGLEVWGAAGPGGDDANKFSLMGDPPIPGGPKVAVWNYIGGVASPYITTAAIATAIDRPNLVDQIDLDAMMVYDQFGDDTFTYEGDPAGGIPPDSIMFSIAPITNPIDGLPPLDGGEIWVWDFAGAGSPAAFLIHGGEVWNTVHSVSMHFGLPMDMENINALEAVPEPATLLLLGLGALAFLRRH